jgi:hypothetical protein
MTNGPTTLSEEESLSTELRHPHGEGDKIKF